MTLFKFNDKTREEARWSQLTDLLPNSIGNKFLPGEIMNGEKKIALRFLLDICSDYLIIQYCDSVGISGGESTGNNVAFLIKEMYRLL